MGKQLRSIALSDIVPSKRRVFRTKSFSRWVSKTELSDHNLCEAVAEMAAGLIGADLGGHVFKKRMATPGRGKSGSTRVLVGTRLWNRYFFVYGFEKNRRANIDDRELMAIQKWAATLLKLDASALAEAERCGELTEICHEKKEPYS